MRLLTILIVGLFGVAACTENRGNSGTPAASPDQQPTVSRESQPSSPAAPVDAVTAKLAAGQRLVIVLNDATLVSRLNEISGRHETVAVESGTLIPGNDGSKGWCELANGDGFVSGGDRFEVKAAEYSEKVYLGATRTNIKASSTLYFQCQKGGMDQTPMSITDLKTILGTLVSIDLEN